MTDELHETLISTAASLAAAISLLERGGKAVKKAAPSDKMFDMMLEDYRNSLNEARAALAAAPQPAPDDPYAALSQHLHGDGEVRDPSMRIKPMKWTTDPTGALYAIDGLGAEWTITHSFGRSTAVRRHGTATVETISAAIPAADMALLVQRLRDDRIRALIDTTHDLGDDA